METEFRIIFVKHKLNIQIEAKYTESTSNTTSSAEQSEITGKKIAEILLHLGL